MSSIINTYITPIVTIITTYILPLTTIITTHITPLIALTKISYSLILIKKLINRTRIKREAQQYTTVTWVTGGRVAGLRPISTSPVNIKYFSTIAKGRVSGLLRPIPNSTIFTTLINTRIK